MDPFVSCHAIAEWVIYLFEYVRWCSVFQEREEAAAGEHAAVDAFAWGSIVEGGPLDTDSEYDRRLSAGAAIACRLRGAVREKLGNLPRALIKVQQDAPGRTLVTGVFSPETLKQCNSEAAGW